VLHVAGGEAVSGEEDVGTARLFDEAVVAEVRVRGAFALAAGGGGSAFGLLLQLVARVVGRFDLGRRVLAQPLLVRAGVLGFVGVGGVVEALRVELMLAWRKLNGGGGVMALVCTSISSGLRFL
jgi:hypothetical protein